MPKIVLRNRVTFVKDIPQVQEYFSIEGIEEEGAFAILKTAFKATWGTGPMTEFSDAEEITPNFKDILALDATGFEWEAVAAVKAVQRLSYALRSATHAQIHS